MKIQRRNPSCPSTRLHSIKGIYNLSYNTGDRSGVKTIKRRREISNKNSVKKRCLEDTPTTNKSKDQVQTLERYPKLNKKRLKGDSSEASKRYFLNTSKKDSAKSSSTSTGLP